MKMINAVESLAVAKVVDAKDVREEVLPGKYDVDVVVRIKGSIKVGEDYTQNVPAAARPWALLALALSKLNGVTIDSLTREALGLSEDQEKEIKAKAEESIQSIKDTTERKCKGKVTTNLEVEKVEAPA